MTSRIGQAEHKGQAKQDRQNRTDRTRQAEGRAGQVE
jgi:hypothetical protein